MADFLNLTEVKVLGSGGGSGYSAVSDFSAAQNPTGAWAYGYRAAGGQFTPYASNANVFGAGAASWSQPSISWCCPSVTKNTTGSTLTYGNGQNIVQPADVLNLHPGPNNERSVARWTAPAAGIYQIDGRFRGLDNGARNGGVGTTTDVAVAHNSTSVFSDNVNGFGAQASFSITRAVAAGDTIEFSVGYGSNNTYNSDSTGLAATIYLITSYTAAGDFSAAQNPTGAWAYGYKPSGGSFTPYTTNANVFGAGTSSWSQPSLSWCCPSVTKNTTGSTITYRNIVQPTDMLNLHPGPNNERSVARWTAPAAGTYRIEGRFQGIDSGFGTTTDVEVAYNGTSIFAGSITGFYSNGSPSTAAATFSLTRSVQAGDTVEFSVGYGSNNTFNSDSTGLLATITAAGSWQKFGDPANPLQAVLPVGPDNQWDGRYWLALKSVVKNDASCNCPTYYGYYHALNDPSSPYQIGLATSNDGVNWTKHQEGGVDKPIFSPNPVGNTWDHYAVLDPLVWKEGSSWYMLYSGQPVAPPPGNLSHTDIGLATSNDGVNWMRSTASPVLAANSSDCQWDSAYISPTGILKEGSTYYLYYWGFDDIQNYQHFKVGLATSTDLIHWSRYQEQGSQCTPVLSGGGVNAWDAGILEPFVQKFGNIYFMWYQGNKIPTGSCSDPSDASAIGLATSLDKVHWTKSSQNPILSGRPGFWDSNWTEAPVLVHFGPAEWRLYYSGSMGSCSMPRMQTGFATWQPQ